MSKKPGAVHQQLIGLTREMRENVRANLRRLVKRILRKHGYPPDKQEAATQTVLQQAAALSEGSEAQPSQ